MNSCPPEGIDLISMAFTATVGFLFHPLYYIIIKYYFDPIETLLVSHICSGALEGITSARLHLLSATGGRLLNSVFIKSQITKKVTAHVKSLSFI